MKRRDFFRFRPIRPKAYSEHFLLKYANDHSNALICGCVLPKKYLRRAVSRNAIRRIIKQIVLEKAIQLQGFTILIMLHKNPVFMTSNALGKASAWSGNAQKSMKNELNDLFKVFLDEICA